MAANPPLTPSYVEHPIPRERIDPDAMKVVRRLVQFGYEAYLVGGCVRDLLLDQRPKDFDVATSARPNEVRRTFRNCRIIGRRFRLAHILFAGGKRVEVATFRRDPTAETADEDGAEPESNGDAAADPMDDGAIESAPAEPAPTVDVLIRDDNVFGNAADDALRRDFTINALFYDVERQRIIDYVEGMRDIEQRLVRTIGQPSLRFREDPVRILRAIKFAARLDLGIEPDVYDAMVAHKDEIHRSAKPRVLEEIFRLLRGGAAQRSIWLAYETGVLAIVLAPLAEYLDALPREDARLWTLLRIADRRALAGETLTDSGLLSLLLYYPLRDALAAQGDAALLAGRQPDAIGAFVQPIADQLTLPRRHRDRIRHILLAVLRIEAGGTRLRGLMKRDFFADAAAMSEIVGQAERGAAAPRLSA